MELEGRLDGFAPLCERRACEDVGLAFPRFCFVGMRLQWQELEILAQE